MALPASGRAEASADHSAARCRADKLPSLMAPMLIAEAGLGASMAVPIIRLYSGGTIAKLATVTAVASRIDARDQTGWTWLVTGF
jgi:hypothetical protein